MRRNLGATSFQFKKGPAWAGPERKTPGSLILPVSQRLGYKAGAKATRANADGADSPVRRLMTHALQIGGETAFGLDVGMADQIAHLRLFTTKFAFFAHDVPLFA